MKVKASFQCSRNPQGIFPCFCPSFSQVIITNPTSRTVFTKSFFQSMLCVSLVGDSSRISVVGVLETFRNLIFFVQGKFSDSCQTNTEEVNKHLLGLFFVFLEHNTLNTHHNLDPWNVRIYKRITYLKGFPSFPISRETYSFKRKYIVCLWFAD